LPGEIVTAPVTSITIFILKEGVKVEDFAKILDPFRANFISKVPGHHASAWSVDSTNERKIFLFGGWDSVEAHTKLTTVPEVVKQRSETFALLDDAQPPKTLHVKFNN